MLATFYPLLGSRDVADITTEEVDRAKMQVPAGLEHSTRRLYLRTLRRVFELAVDPLRLIESSPVKGKFVPRARKGRQFPFLYPSEDAQLCGYLEMELEYRFLYAFLGRNGARISETLRARWSQCDLERGVFRMENTKTGRTRYWKLDPDVDRALVLRWHQMSEPSGDALIFVAPGGGQLTHQMVHGRFRQHLKDAGVNRVELHTDTPERRKLRVHDLRATFVTLALAAGRTERWVMDRTGHETSVMLARYSRQARHAAELGLGWFEPMDQALGLATGSGPQPIKPTAANETSAAAVTAQHADPIELALAAALRAATEAQQWQTVLRITAELAERRRERAPAEAAE
jgi:integrase